MGNILIGIDEAGMGTLAGPMTAAIVIIEADKVPKGVKDSKKLNDASREELAAAIMDAAFDYRIESRESRLIDRFGLSDCWEGLMYGLAVYGRAVRDVHCVGKPEMIVDGNRFIPDAPYVKPIVKADATHPAVSAASILAKYQQSCWMDDLELQYPWYGFRNHRGYGTVEHMRALAEHGPCPEHRKSYKPVKESMR